MSFTDPRLLEGPLVVNPWRVEVLSWPRLAHDRQHEFLQMAGEAGGEWWGGGRIVLSAYPAASRLSAHARAHGFFVRLEQAHERPYR